MTTEAMKLALAYVGQLARSYGPESEAYSVAEALRQAIEQAQPVGEVLNERGEVDWISFVPPVGTHLYTAPPPRQPLTDEEIRELTGNAGTLMQEYAIKVARAIEAKLKEKNNV